ncbi:VOC family protein [Flagellimonas amoyensis]|uniref:VOC family protein n=1 Tax=Flagellimonas amoyensis TaxID=2169401 RepID=UPI000D369D64|nr:VOC family protein [Allomuricauda amoyensis]
MNQIITYLTFNGNCREAMEFYQECLGGKLEVQTLEDTPKAEVFPKNFKGFVVQAALKKDGMLLMGTDMVDRELVKGNSISILLGASNEEQLQEYYQKLKRESISSHPLDKTHWGNLFGSLVDKYGNEWLFHYQIE